MFEVKTRLVAPALLALAGITLVGCSSATQDGPRYPLQPSAYARYNIDLAKGVLDVPYPMDPIFFIGSKDLTLNLPTIAYRADYVQKAMNGVDGWSTSSVLTTAFSVPLDPASINKDTVKVIKVWINPENKGPVDVTKPEQWKYLPAGWNLQQGPVAGILEYGKDFTAVRSVDAGAAMKDIDSAGQFLEIVPLKPWDASKGPFLVGDATTPKRVLNVGYLVLLTNGLKSEGGDAMGSDALYSSLRSADCTTITDAIKQGLCGLIQGQLKLADATKPATGVGKESVIVSWNFSVQSTDDTLTYLSLTAQGKAVDIIPTGATSPYGKANLYVGYTYLPYYQKPPVNSHDGDTVLTSFWKAAQPPPSPLTNQPGDPVNYLTMFNPVPAPALSLEKVPVLVTIPKTTSPSACAGVPPGGWPVVIVQHGLGGSRAQAISMADAYADACFIVAAVDLPLHGITIPYDPEPDSTDPFVVLQSKISCAGATPNPICLGAHERTFDLDIWNNETETLTAKDPATGYYLGDGNIDPASGANGLTYFNLNSPLSARDNIRQGEIDLVQFTKSLKNLGYYQPDAASIGVGVNPSRIHFVGLSLGAIVGGSHIHFNNDLQTATISAPGGTITQLLNDSDYFGPILRQILGAKVTPDSYLYNLALRDVQVGLDAADPISHIKDAQAMHPTFLIKVLEDGVVPNNSTDRLVAAGSFTKLVNITTGNPVCPGSGGYSVFKAGTASHGTLFDPSASLSATMEMQAQAVSFAASAGAESCPSVSLGLVDSSVLDLSSSP